MRLIQRLAATVLLVNLSASAQADPQYWQDQVNEIRTRIQHIDTAGLKALVEAGEDFLLVDVRMPDEIAEQGRIDAPQYLNIPRGWLEVRIGEHALDEETQIVIHCGGALRSAFATDTLRQMGYLNVFNYKDGLNDWRAKGLPTVD